MVQTSKMSTVCGKSNFQFKKKVSKTRAYTVLSTEQLTVDGN